MVNWRALQSMEDLERLIEQSFQRPCLIYKHSTRCGISRMAQYRLEDHWDLPEEALEPYFLDLLRHRALSDEIARRFEVRHESPQVLLIVQGRCICHASHLDISLPALKACLEQSPQVEG